MSFPYPLQCEAVSDSLIQDRAPAVSPLSAVTVFSFSFLISAWISDKS